MSSTDPVILEADAIVSCKTTLADYDKPSLSNPTLPPQAEILQVTPSNDLHSLRKHRLNFHQLNRVGGKFGLNHTADQEVLLFGHGLDRGPLGQQKFFRVQRVHG